MASKSKSSGSRSSGSKSSRSRSSTSSRSHTSKSTTNHDKIRAWVEARGGAPACVKGTGGGKDIGMLRIDMPGYSGEKSLQHIDWCDWFDKFDERKLAFLYQDKTAGGKKSSFNKLVDRDESKSRSHGRNAR